MRCDPANREGILYGRLTLEAHAVPYRGWSWHQSGAPGLGASHLNM